MRYEMFDWAHTSHRQGQPYRVPGTQTTLLFSDFGQELQSGLARQFFREAINAVKQMVTTRGDEPIDGGKYVLDRFGLKITILDGQCYPALEYSMSNEILLESLKGLNYFMIEEKFGYYAAVFDVRIPDPLGQEDVVGHAVMQSSNDGSGVEGIDVCIPAGSTE